MTDHVGGHRHGQNDHDHGADDGESSTWRVAIVTVSTSLSGAPTPSEAGATDASGAVARDAIEAAGHVVARREIVGDDEPAIREALESALAETDVVVTSGGTGVTDDDVTIEAVRSLIETELPGVGEYFRRLSHEQVGSSAMLSRATGGVVDGSAVYAFPGSPDAVALGVERVVLPEIDHVLHLARR